MTTKITAAELDEYDQLKTQVDALEADTKPLKTKMKAIADKAKAFLVDSDKTTAKRGDHRISLQEVPGRVSWKDEALKRMKEGETPDKAPSTFKLLITAAALLLMIVPGCLSQASNSAPLTVTDQQFEDTDTGYTGAVVYVSGNGEPCVPCDHIVDDLYWLAETKPGWSVGKYHRDVHNDWTIVSRPQHTRTRVPAIEYYSDGKRIDYVEGYTSAAEWNVRLPLFRDIVGKHPSNAGRG